MKKLKYLLILLMVTTVVIAACYVAFDNINIKPVENLALASSTTNSQTITWAPHQRADYYEIYFSEGASEQFKKLDTIEHTNNPQYTTDNLKSASVYGYQIIAVNEFAKKRYSSAPVSITAYTSPDKVTDLTAATESKKSLTARWNDNQNVDGYVLSYSQNKDFSDAKEIDIASSSIDKKAPLNHIIPDLAEGKTFYLKMRCYLAKNSVKSYSDWCDVATATVTRAIDMTGVDVNKPMVALTFDDGPDYGDVTQRILNTLKQYNSKATFFQLGQRVEELPDVSKRIVEYGNEIACHTYDHSHYGEDTTSNDIVKGNDAIERITGHRPMSFRSTGGMTTDGIRSTCLGQGQSLYYWSIDTLDWQSRDCDSIVSKVQNVTDGDIILMHNIYSSTADAVDQIVPYLVSEGYQLVTVSQLVQAKTGKPPVPGTQYFSATRTN